jgi:hypothetical protein
MSKGCCGRGIRRGGGGIRRRRVKPIAPKPKKTAPNITLLPVKEREKDGEAKRSEV